MKNDVKILAFHLPQFHSFPENDAWWGEGFTEWVNVKKAKQLFPSHNQPRVPLNENYYCLLEESAIRWQMDLAREYGIYGFCYYHYWFDGKLLMEKPLEMMRKMENRLPYCFCWANEPWTRAWDGKTSTVLMPQRYGGEKEWEEHFQYLLQFFQDSSYILVEGKPVLVLYRTNDIPNCEEMIAYFDKRCKENGFAGIYLVEEKNSFQNSICCKNADAILNFEPMYTLKYERSFFSRVVDKLYNKYFNKIHNNKMLVYSYDSAWKRILKRKSDAPEGKREFRGGFVDWDNSPRKQERGMVVLGATPEKFQYYLGKQMELAREEGSEFVFINAWNEWAEGTYLEPDTCNGYGYLEAIRKLTEGK